MEYDSAELGFELDRTLADMHVSQRFIVRDVMRVMANNVMKLSFPSNAKEGRQAIDADLNKIFNTLDDPQVVEYFNNRFGDGSATQGGKLKGKKRQKAAREELQGVIFNWSGDQGKIQQWHRSQRRNGKVKTRERVVARIGNWEFHSGMYVTRTALNKYKRQVYRSIAKFKAGWLPAVEWLSSVTGGRAIAPAFVQKQAQRRGGVEEWKNDSGYEGVTIVNKIPYARKMTAFVLRKAEMITNAYSQKATKKQAEDIARRFNERSAAA